MIDELWDKIGGFISQKDPNSLNRVVWDIFFDDEGLANYIGTSLSDIALMEFEARESNDEFEKAIRKVTQIKDGLKEVRQKLITQQIETFT
jgi:hypothetical protein